MKYAVKLSLEEQEVGEVEAENEQKAEIKARCLAREYLHVMYFSNYDIDLEKID